MRIGERQLHRLDLKVEALRGINRQISDMVMPRMDGPEVFKANALI